MDSGITGAETNPRPPPMNTNSSPDIGVGLRRTTLKFEDLVLNRFTF